MKKFLYIELASLMNCFLWTFVTLCLDGNKLLNTTKTQKFHFAKIIKCNDSQLIVFFLTEISKWNKQGILKSFFIRKITHFKNQLATLDNFTLLKETRRNRFAIQTNRLDVDVFIRQIAGFYRQ